MKEEEAKTKWCPMFRKSAINNRGGSSTNRMSQNENVFDESPRCIASDCMMWIQTDNEGSPSDAKNDDPSNAVYFPAGHCGLARKA